MVETGFLFVCAPTERLRTGVKSHVKSRVGLLLHIDTRGVGPQRKQCPKLSRIFRREPIYNTHKI